MKASLACLASRSLQQQPHQRHAVHLTSTLQALCGVKQLPAWAVAVRSTQVLRCRAQSTLAEAAQARQGKRKEEGEEETHEGERPAAAKCEPQPTSKRRAVPPHLISPVATSSPSLPLASPATSTSGFFNSHPLDAPAQDTSRARPSDTSDALWSSTLSPTALEALVSPLAGYARAGLSNASDLSSELLTRALSSGAHLSAYASSSSDGLLAASEEARLLLLLHICSHDNGRRRDTAQLAGAMALYEASVASRFDAPKPHYRDLLKLQRKVMHAYIGLLLRVAAGQAGAGALKAAASALSDPRVRPTQARYLTRKTLSLLQVGGGAIAKETWAQLAASMEELLGRGTMETWTSSPPASDAGEARGKRRADETEPGEEGSWKKEAWAPGRELHRCLVCLARAQQPELVVRLAHAARSAAQAKALSRSSTASSSSEEGEVEWAKPIVQLNVLRLLMHASNGKGALAFLSLVARPHRTQGMYHALFVLWGETAPAFPPSSARSGLMRVRPTRENARQVRALTSARLWADMCAAHGMRPTLETFEARMKSHARARTPGLVWADLKAMRRLGLLRPPGQEAAAKEGEGGADASQGGESGEAHETQEKNHKAWLTRLPAGLTLSLLRTLNRSNLFPASLRFATRIFEAHARLAVSSSSAPAPASPRATAPLLAHKQGAYSPLGTAMLNTLLQGALAPKQMSRAEQRGWDTRWERVQARRADVVAFVAPSASVGRVRRFFGRGSRRGRGGMPAAAFAQGSVATATRAPRTPSAAARLLRQLINAPRPHVARRTLLRLRHIVRLAHAHALPFDGISRAILLLALARAARTSAGELRELLRLGFGVESVWAEEVSSVLSAARKLLAVLDAHDAQLSEEQGLGTDKPRAKGEAEIRHVKLPLLQGLAREAKKRHDADIAREMLSLLARLKARLAELADARAVKRSGAREEEEEEE